MKRIIQLTVAVVLLGSLTIQAIPERTWCWDDPVEYEDNTPISFGDLTDRRLHCGMQAGGPYPAEHLFSMEVCPSVEDMEFVVAGIPGEYYCVSTVMSAKYQTRSGYSNEINFMATPVDLGKVPKEMILRLGNV